MNIFIRNKVLLLVIFLAGTQFNEYTYAQKSIKPLVNDRLFPSVSATMNGYVGQKLDAAYNNRILAQDVNRLIQPFQNKTEERCWQSEFWGKWITSAIQAYQYKPEKELKQRIDEAVTRLIATKSRDGYIGNYAEHKHLEQWDIWGRKYSMLGLLAYYDLTRDYKSLTAAKGIADHLIKELADKKVNIVEKGNHRGMAASSILEPVTQLYTRTGDKKYLAFAEEIVRQWELPVGPQLISKAGIDVGKRFPVPKEWWGWEQGQKAYEMMSCYEGLLELYRLTSNEKYRNAVIQVWENIRDTEINIVGSGASMECWFGGKNLQHLVAMHYQETCVTATWIKLSQQLLRLTGETRYADAVEQAFYNGLLGSMTPDGSSWAKYSPLSGIRSEGEDQCKMGLNCCVASGPRGLYTIPHTAVMGNNEGVYINFFIDGSYTFKSSDGINTKLSISTDYPVSGVIKIKSESTLAKSQPLFIRIPAWSKKTMVSVNGKQTEAKSGEFIKLDDVQKGKEVTVTLDMRARVEKINEMPVNIAIVRGPVVLARDIRMTGKIDIDEIITPVMDDDGYVRISELKSNGNKDIWMSFEIPCYAGSYRAEGERDPVTMTFCDYSSAGNTYSNESRFRIWFPQLLDPETMVNK